MPSRKVDYDAPFDICFFDGDTGWPPSVTFSNPLTGAFLELPFGRVGEVIAHLQTWRLARMSLAIGANVDPPDWKSCEDCGGFTGYYYFDEPLEKIFYERWDNSQPTMKIGTTACIDCGRYVSDERFAELTEGA